MIESKSFFSSGVERPIDSERLIEWFTAVFLTCTKGLVSISMSLLTANDS